MDDINALHRRLTAYGRRFGARWSFTHVRASIERLLLLYQLGFASEEDVTLFFQEMGDSLSRSQPQWTTFEQIPREDRAFSQETGDSAGLPQATTIDGDGLDQDAARALLRRYPGPFTLPTHGCLPPVEESILP